MNRRTALSPFVLTLSKYEWEQLTCALQTRPFDRLRANGVLGVEDGRFGGGVNRRTAPDPFVLSLSKHEWE